MDRTTRSISSSCNNDDGAAEETGMEKALSDLQALKKLYGLLQRLDETSRALLTKLLGDATRQALVKQAQVIPFSIGMMSEKMDQATSSSSSCLNNKETEMQQISSDLQALERLYELLHKGPADQNLDEASRTLLMKILEDATQEAVRRQAKILSGSLMSPALERKPSIRSDCRTRHDDPRLRPLASPSTNLLASERSRRLNLQHSTLSSRSGSHVDGHRHAAEEPLLARLASKRSSRTALPARHRPSQEQRHSSLTLHRFPVAETSQRGTVTGSTRHADHRDSIGRSSGRGDQRSLERSSSSSARSVSREPSLGPSRLHRGRPAARHVGAESSTSVRLFERLDSGLSLATTSRHGVENTGHGLSSPEYSSSSKTMVTIQSRIGPSNTLLMDRSLRRSAEEGSTSRWRQRGDVSSADNMYSSMYSGSGSSSGASSQSASRSPTASPPASRAFSSYHYSPVMPRGFAVPPVMPRGIAVPPVMPRGIAVPPVMPRGIAVPPVMPRGIAVPPVYAPEVSRRAMRRRRRQEVLEKRVERLRMLKNKIATVFHHRHDHHHHHHLGGGQEGPSSSSRSVVVHRAHDLKSPWQYLTGMLQRAKGKGKKASSRAVVGVPAGKRRGGGGNMHALFDAMRRHLKGKRKAPAGIKLRRKASRVRANKMHWWQRLRRRRGVAGLMAGSKRRRHLGHGKGGWL